MEDPNNVSPNLQQVFKFASSQWQSKSSCHASSPSLCSSMDSFFLLSTFAQAVTIPIIVLHMMVLLILTSCSMALSNTTILYRFLKQPIIPGDFLGFSILKVFQLCGEKLSVMSFTCHPFVSLFFFLFSAIVFENAKPFQVFS